MSAAPFAPTGCAVTVVEAHGPILAKRWHADGRCEPYGNARSVTLHPHPVANFSALAVLVRDLLTVPRCCIVRGEPVAGETMARVRRLLHPDPETGEAPTLREVPRRWVAVDVDSVPVAPGTDLHDLAACARAVLPRLPFAFREATALVQATAGHTFKPGVRLRLWYWLSRPVGEAELKLWFAGTGLDLSIFQTNQAIYTAAPLFHGMADPLADRLAMLPGARPVVTVPAASLLRPVVRVAPISARARSGDGGGRRFDALARTVRDAAEGTRHRALFWAACRAGEMVAGGEIDAATAAADLARAAMEGGGKDRKNAEATARDGIKRGQGGGR